MNHIVGQGIRSDDLKNLRDIFGGGAFIANFSQIVRIDLILDANIILAEIRWLSSRRKKPEARSALLENLICGTVKAFAPDFLIEEVEKNLPKISKDDSIPLEILLTQWGRYRPYIEFITIDALTEKDIEGAQDPKDLPYIKLQEKIGAFIYSNDSDIVAMNGRIIKAQVIVSLRDYSRFAAVEYHLKFAGIISLTVSAHMIKVAISLIKMLADKTKKLPPWVIGLGALLIIIAVAHPKSREIAFSWIKSLSQNARDAGLALLNFSIPLVHEHNQAQERATEEMDNIREQIAG